MMIKKNKVTINASIFLKFFIKLFLGMEIAQKV